MIPEPDPWTLTEKKGFCHRLFFVVYAARQAERQVPTKKWWPFISIVFRNCRFNFGKSSYSKSKIDFMSRKKTKIESKPIIFIDEVWIFFYRVVFKVFAFPSIISPTVAILAPNGQTFLNIIHVPFIIVTFIRDGFRYSKIEFWVVVHKIIPRIGWKRQVDQ